MDITKAKEFLERQGLDDCHYQDTGMIEHIAEQMEMYHTEQLSLAGVSNCPSELEPTTNQSLLNVGDKVICLAKNGNNKHLSVGKKYTIIENNLRDRPKIKNNIGKTYSLRLEKDEWSKAY